MKIAILLCGNLRTYDRTYQSFLNAFSQVDIDVFCHTWDTLGHTDSVWWSTCGDGRVQDVDSSIIERVKAFYSPKKVQVDKSMKFVSSNPDWNILKGYSATKSQWESNYRANLLRKEYEKETGIKYDLVLKTRYDIRFEEVFSSEFLESQANQGNANFLNTPTAIMKNFYNDIMFFAPPEKMDIIMELRNNLDNYLHYAIEDFGILEGESPCTHWVKDTIKETNKYIFKCYIERLAGNGHKLYPK